MKQTFERLAHALGSGRHERIERDANCRPHLVGEVGEVDGHVARQLGARQLILNTATQMSQVDMLSNLLKLRNHTACHDQYANIQNQLGELQLYRTSKKTNLEGLHQQGQLILAARSDLRLGAILQLLALGVTRPRLGRARMALNQRT